MNGESVRWIPLESWATEKQREEVLRVWALPLFAQVVGAVKKEGLGCYLVGGCVRDLLLGRESKDLDLTIDCSAKELLGLKSRLKQSTGATVVPLDVERGIVRLCFEGHQELDLVARQGDDLLADLMRRDLTVNAVGLSAEGALADPSGGLADLEAGVLREVRAGNFLEDPLRALRVLRFAAQLGFEVEAATRVSAREALQTIERVAGERIGVELCKFFEAARGPALGLLRESGLEEALGFGAEAGNWELLESVAETGVVGWPRGVALWISSRVSVEAVCARLKLSNREQRFLEHWRRGEVMVREARDWDLGDVYDLALTAGPAFQDFARTLECLSFVPVMRGTCRERVRREAEGRGRLRWSKPPWDGHLLRERLGREPGPWLKDALARLAKAWALGEIEDLEQGVRVLGL